jgi:repressor LexA
MTTRQEILKFIIDYKAAHDGNSPNTREIGSAVGLASVSTVHHHLHALVAEGSIRLPPKWQARSIEVVGGAWTMTEQAAIPPNRANHQ